MRLIEPLPFYRYQNFLLYNKVHVRFELLQSILINWIKVLKHSWYVAYLIAGIQEHILFVSFQPMLNRFNLIIDESNRRKISHLQSLEIIRRFRLLLSPLRTFFFYKTGHYSFLYSFHPYFLA